MKDIIRLRTQDNDNDEVPPDKETPEDYEEYELNRRR